MGPAPLPSAADDIFVKLYHFFLFIHSLVVEENYLIRRRRGSEWQEAARIITTHPITFLLRGGTWINIRGPEESLEQQPRKETRRLGHVGWNLHACETRQGSPFAAGINKCLLRSVGWGSKPAEKCACCGRENVGWDKDDIKWWPPRIRGAIKNNFLTPIFNYSIFLKKQDR